MVHAHMIPCRFKASVVPPDALRGLVVSYSEGDWTIEIDDGVIVLSTTSNERNDIMWAQADKQLQLVVRDLAWNGIQFSAYVSSCETGADATVRPAPAIAKSAVGRPTVLVDGKIAPTRYPAWSRNATALQARDYYLAGERNRDYVMFYLFKAMECLKPQGCGWQDLSHYLALSEKDAKDFIDYVKGRANRGRYDERHAPRPGENPVKLSQYEIDECRRRVRRLIELYCEKASSMRRLKHRHKSRHKT